MNKKEALQFLKEAMVIYSPQDLLTVAYIKSNVKDINKLSHRSLNCLIKNLTDEISDNANGNKWVNK